MIFRLENAGPLRHAEVDLSKKLIVLTGPNNAGKTWLAWSVYGLYKARPVLPTAMRLAKELIESPEGEIRSEDGWAGVREQMLAELGVALPKELEACFAAPDGFLRCWCALSEAPREPLRQRAAVAMIDEDGAFWIVFGWNDRMRLERITKADLNSGAFGSVFAQYIGGGVRPRAWRDSLRDANIGPEVREALSANVANRLGSFLDPSGVERANVEVFPAERIAVNLFARELSQVRSDLVDELLESTANLAQVRMRASRYPWAIRDAVRVANDLPNASKRTTDHADLADLLEQKVVGGRVGVSEHGDLHFRPEQWTEAPVPLHLTASVVKSLASLVFYFRHLAVPGALLIIDEPELNLHPDSQRRLAQVLAMAVNRGFRLLLSTHSDWFLRELNRLILASAIPSGELSEHGLAPENVLRPDDVGVYLLQNGECSPVKVSSEGFSIATIDAETNRLNEAEQRMYERLARG